MYIISYRYKFLSCKISPQNDRCTCEMIEKNLCSSSSDIIDSAGSGKFETYDIKYTSVQKWLLAHKSAL
jgi:hypothetical protein